MRRNALALLFCRLGADLANLLFFVLISRQFGPAGAGVYAYGFAIAGFIYVAATLGVDDYAIREYTRSEPQRRATLLNELLGAQLCVAGVAGLALLGYLTLTQPDASITAAVLLLSAYQICSALSGTLFVPAMAQEQMTAPAVTLFVSRVLAFLIAAGLLSATGSIPIALSAFVAAGVLLMWLAARNAAHHGHKLRFMITTHSVQRRGRELWSFAGADLLSQLIARIAVIALTLQLGAAAAGVYATGMKVIEAACLPLLFLSAAAYPKLCAVQRTDEAAFRRFAGALIGWSFVGAAVIAVVMYAAAPRLLVPLFGSQYDGAQQTIAAMALLAFVQAAEIAPGRVMLAANLQVARAALLACSALVCVLLVFIAIPTWGVHAAIAATSLAYLLLVVSYLHALRSASRARPHTEALPNTT